MPGLPLISCAVATRWLHENPTRSHLSMPAVRLSKRTIDALTPRERTAIVYDRDLTVFVIRITPAGAKSYIVEYRPGAGGRRTSKRRLTLGSVGALTPDEARAEARRRLASVALGDDPARERAARRRACTMAELIERFLIEEVQPTRRASTAKLYAHYFEKHLVPRSELPLPTT